MIIYGDILSIDSYSYFQFSKWLNTEVLVEEPTQEKPRKDLNRQFLFWFGWLAIRFVEGLYPLRVAQRKTLDFWKQI